MAQINCRYFNGYKPCGLNSQCDSKCPSYSPVTSTIALIHLGALGAVVRSTALIQAIRIKYPQSKLVWITDKPANHLLAGHPDLDLVLTTEPADLLVARSFQIQTAYVIDKSLKASGVAETLAISNVIGFKAVNGSILPANQAAAELWELGLSNQKKFFENTKSEVQLMCEAFELAVSEVPDYNLPLTSVEVFEAQKRKLAWQANQKIIVGINTGCSDVIAAKKLTITKHRELIQSILNKYQDTIQIVLLGGPEDTARNAEIARGLDVISSSTISGLRDGLVSVAACDIILTGDSLGMHMAISQKKYVIAWFGPTCAHEIELYGRGESLLAEVPCGPCWKRSCQKETMCYDQVPIKKWHQALQKGLQFVSKSRHSDSIPRGSSALGPFTEAN